MPRKILPRDDFELSRIEKAGNPESVAMEHLNVSYYTEKKIVGPPRASSLHKSCVRMHSLGVQNQVEYIEKIPLGLKITFDIGDAVHFRVQNTPNYFGNNRYGWWKCSSCGAIRGFGKPPTWNCKTCGAKPSAAIYHEHHLSAPNEYECSGHPDMFIRVLKRLRVVEIKTISSNQFPGLIAPLVDHSWQIQFYMWASKHDDKLRDRVFPKTGYVLYVSKGMIFRGIPLKMFVVKRDEHILNKIRGKLDLYLNSVNGGKLPPRLNECEAKQFSGPMASECPCVALCKGD